MRRSGRALTASLLLCASFGAAAQSASFTAPGSQLNVTVGDPVFAELLTQDANSIPIGGGVLDWSLISCTALSFATIPPGTADSDGLTSAELIAQSPGTCFLSASWDDDNNAFTPPIFPSQSLQINVTGGPIQTANIDFTAPDFFLFFGVGETADVEVATTDKGMPIGGGVLVWDLLSCPHINFTSPPPATADVDGFTSAEIIGLSSGSCTVLARWDHDNDPGTPDAVASPTLDVFVFPGPITTLPVSGPAPIIPFFENPAFTISATQDGGPAVGAFVQWSVSFEGGQPQFFGSLCSGAFTTDSNGEASFDFNSVKLSTQLGSYEVTGEVGDGQCRDGKAISSKATAQRGVPAAPATFNFEVEEAEVLFDNPPSEFQVGVPTPFDVLLQTTPSGVPIPDIDFDWFADIDATMTSGVTPPTDSAGRTSFSLTANSPQLFALVEIFDVNKIGLSNEISVDIFELGLVVDVLPPSQSFTDDVAAAVEVFAFKSFGSGGGKSARRGFDQPVGDIPVTFTITSNNGTFTANNSQQFVALTGAGIPAVAGAKGGSMPGVAVGSPVLIGRTASPVVVSITSPGFPSTSTSYTTIPSTYSIQHASPSSITIDVAQTAQLTAQVLRSSISTPAPIGAGETVTWAVTAPANGASVTPASVTDSGSNATTTFTPSAPGIYEVIAQFDPGIAGVSPDTVVYTIEVTGTLIDASLTPFEGDFTSGAPGLVFPISVRYLEDGQPATPSTPQTVLWSVSSGDATISPSSSAVSAGTALAGTTVTFGSTPGPVVVVAQLADSPNVSTFFYLDIIENTVLEVIDPASRRFDLLPGTPFDILLALRSESGVGLVKALIQVSGDLADLPSELLTGAGGSASVSGVAPDVPGIYRVTFLYEGIGSVGRDKATGIPPIAETVIVNVIEPTGGASLIASEGNGQTGTVGQPAQPLKALYTEDNVPVQGVSVQWTVNSGGGTPASQTTTTDVDGFATFEYTFGDTPGPVSITARSGEVSAEFTLTAQPAAGFARLIPSEGDGQRGLVGRAALPLKALYTENELPVQGASVLWTVISGGGTPTSQTTSTDADGFATFNYTFGLAPGPVVIQASRGPEVTAQFLLTAELAQLSVVSGNGQRGPIQTDADLPLIVQLSDPAGVGVPNQTIQWSLSSGSAILGGGAGNSAQSVTDSSGRAQLSFSYGPTAGAIAIQANSTLAAMPVQFAAQAEIPGLRLLSGNNQTGEPGTPLADDLVVSIAPELSKALGGVTVVWDVLAGGGSVNTTSSITDANGQARNQFTLGAQAGVNQVRASIPGGPSVVFSAEGVFSAAELTKVSGDNQTNLPTNLDSAPLVVRLRQPGSGAPVANATIVWSGGNAGFVVPGSTALANETTSLTNGQGEARIVARVIASGPATVSARLQDSAGDPLVFSLQGAIANTPTLNANEEAVAEVLDSACIGLAALGSRTPAQEDLLQRCRELQRSSGPNPEDVAGALEELDPDVALAMTDAGVEIGNTQITNVNSYLIEARNNPGGRGQFRLALATADGALPLSFLPGNVLAANAAADQESAEGQDLGPDFGRWGFFASGTIGRGKYRDGDRTPDYDYNSGNLTVGVDYRLNDSVILGGGLGFTRHDTDLRNDGGNLETSGFNFVGYASWYNERQWFVDGVLTLGRNDYDLKRNLRYSIGSTTGGVTTINQVASSSTEGDQLGFSLAVGRDWQKGPWSLNSYLRANYLRTDYDSYAEQMIANLPGAGLALAVDARTLTNTSGVLGGKATYVLSRDWGILMPHAQLEFEHSFEDDPSQLVARFLADPTGGTFVQLGDDVDTDFFNVGIGMSALWPGGRSAYLAYERLVGSSQLSQDTLSIGVRIEF
jgi:outer membrane autotransporter protein